MTGSQRWTPTAVYFAVFIALLLLTAVTVAVAFVDLGVGNNVAAVGIAACKATLVVLFFMHVRGGRALVGLTIAAGVIWLAILMGLTMSDLYTRTW